MAIQRDEAWLKTATPDEINAAYYAGELEALQGHVVRTYPDIGSIPNLQRDQEWVDNATPEKIAAAMEAGELDAILGRIAWPANTTDQQNPAQGVYGDGTILTHPKTPRGDIPVETGPATVLGVGVDPKDAVISLLAERMRLTGSPSKNS